MPILVLGVAHGAKTKVIEPVQEDDKTQPVAAALTEEQRQLAMERFAVLQPHLEDDVPLARAARHASIPLRTAESWLALYRRSGFAGLVRAPRRDADAHRLPAEVVGVIEGTFPPTARSMGLFPILIRQR